MHSLVPAAHDAGSTTLRATSKTKKVALLLFSVATLLTGGTTVMRGQSALDAFDPNANGPIYIVVAQPDGKILIGGSFTTLAPNGGAAVTRNHIARLNPDGTLDTAFNPSAGGSVYAIALQPNGKILVGGVFATIGGQARQCMARLDATTGLADSFNPNPDAYVFALSVQLDGKILAGGFFNGIGGQQRNYIARLDPATGLVDSFNPNSNGVVRSIAVQADGRVVIGGDFTNVSGTTHRHIARLSPTTGLADSFDPGANNDVYAVVVQPDSKILVGGYFNGSNSIGGQSRNGIARLDATTGLADSLDPNADGAVLSIAIQSDGKILTGGTFANIGGQARNNIARLDPTLGLADSFNPSASDQVWSIAVQADGKILLGGFFSSVATNGSAVATRNGIARLESDGRLDQTLSLSTIGEFVFATAVQPDGKILIGGNFTNVLGVARNYIARLNTDGTLDTVFNPNANSYVYSIAVQEDGKILVGGFFLGANSIGGQPRNRIARLDSITGLADSFNPNANSSVYSIVTQGDGKILVGGDFTSVGGKMRNYIARLDATTGLADSFDPVAVNNVRSITIQRDGKILLGGSFFSIGGQTRNRIARVNSDGSLDTTFNPNANGFVYSIALQADGKILAGGQFGSIGGQTRNGIARLDTTTGSADSWNPNTNGFVFSIALQADGKILAGGNFSGIGGQTRNFIARLDAITGLADTFDPNANSIVQSLVVEGDGKILVGGNFINIGGQARSLFARLTNESGAQQFLAATQTTITWTRGGSSPQLTNVTFESSADNVNYTPLGNGTLTGNSWTLTDVNLPTNQNIYVRARGRHRGGYANGSGSSTESVRNTFLVGPTTTPTPAPTPASTPDLAVTVALPIATINTSVINFIQPVSTSAIDAKDNLIGFQADFTFDSTLLTFQVPPVSAAGLTADNWNVSGNVLPGGGQIRTLRVASFSADGVTPLSSSGVLFNLNMRRISNTPGASTPLSWAAPPNGFLFIDTDLNTRMPSSLPGSITISVPTIGISGTIVYCSDSKNPGPVGGVTLSVTGTSGGSAVSDSSGIYSLTGLTSGGDYTVTPSKSALAPGAGSIDTVDAIAVQQHYLNTASLPPGCRLRAAEVNGDNMVDSVDVIAIQRFFIGRTFGLGNVGRYQFNPASRSYTGLTTDLTAQDYDALIFGDVVSNLTD